MCAAVAGQSGKRVVVLDHARKIAEKIRISGGGRCNFTNIHCHPGNFLSRNRHFSKSALSCYTPHNFIELVQKHGIAYHEKTLGQLFCDGSSQQIINMLLRECEDGDVDIRTRTNINDVNRIDTGFTVHTDTQTYTCTSLVIASGGLSIPKIGASSFGYDLAAQFNIPVIDRHPALVPLTFESNIKENCKSLSGLSVNARVSHNKTTFSEGLLFTHRGLSGPSILQISSYWNTGEHITIDLANGINLQDILLEAKSATPLQTISTVLSRYLPKRLIQSFVVHNGRLIETPDKILHKVAQDLHTWCPTPKGTEGYRIAEVTRGGVDTNALSSKTMESKTTKGLYFIGEVLDVTGHLGGHNFQWAWSSAVAAARAISA